MSSLASIRMYIDKYAHKYTQIPAAGQRTHLYPWGVRMHFESCWHGFSSGAQKSNFSSHSSPVDTSTHTRHPNMSKCVCVCWCECRFPIFKFKEILNVIWKRSMQAHREPEELYNSGKRSFTVAPDLEHFTTLNMCTFGRDMKKAQERWKSRKG